MTEPTDVTQLLVAVRNGEAGAMDRLFAAVYADLRDIAHRQLARTGRAATLNTTALVHETYLKLVDRSRVSPEDRRHFFRTAARAMRHILVDYARMKRAAKRGGADTPSGSPTDVLDERSVDVEARATELLAIDRALRRLAEVDERLSRVVELRFFGGFPVEEVADLTDTSPRTVKRDWQIARAFLFRELGEAG